MAGRRSINPLLAAVLVLLGAAAGITGVHHASANALPGFTTGLLPAASTVATQIPHNEDAEPGMAIDGGGTLWIASDIEPYAQDDPRAQTTGTLSGSDVWKSTDHGMTWQWVAAPFQQVSTSQGGLGGEDTDIAASPVQNSNGCYDIWVASLWIGSTSLAVSEDCGASWEVINVNGAFGQDRPWVAAYGQCTVLLSYHSLSLGYQTVIDEFGVPPCVTDQGTGFTTPPSMVQQFTGGSAPGLTNRFGKLVVDNSPASPYQGTIYQPEMGCPNTGTPGLQTQVAGCMTTAQVYMAVGSISSNSLVWNDYLVHDTGNTTVYIWPDTAAVDSAGNVYIAWMEGPSGEAQYLYIAKSSDGGQHWTSPVLVNQASFLSGSGSPSLSGAYPTVSAGLPGRVDVAWYGTERDGGTDDETVMGLPNTTYTSDCGTSTTPACTPADWQLWWATSSDYGQNFQEEPVTGTIHTGQLCTEGGGCVASDGDRNLLDDFGALIDPATQGEVITFSNDQPGGAQGRTHTDYATENVSAPAETPDLLSPALGILLAATGAAMLVVRRRRLPGSRHRSGS
jgi:hypothetical protein